MIQLLQNLYGEDAINTSLKILFEFASYFISGLLGAVIREILIEKERKFLRVFGSSLLVGVFLFSISSYLKTKVDDWRLTFGLAVLIGVYLPNFAVSLKNGKIFKHILRFFSERIYTIVKDVEEEQEHDETTSRENKSE